MPSSSAKQAKLMRAVAHNPAFAKKVGIPQSVGKDFSEADKGRKFGSGGNVKKEMKAAKIFAKAGEKKLAAHERREAMGKEKDTPAIAKKEMAVLKKAKAPKDVMDYEASEHAEMGMARGGGIESRGKTKGKMIKMAGGGSVGSASKRADGIAVKGKTRGKMC
jgi:hypothetical protein